jgi:lysosomal acid lipase/cholesteryl ester hydrolase
MFPLLLNRSFNFFSRKHVNLTENDPSYWSFSFDEMGKYDIPANLDFIISVTKAEKISYVGHSMGTVMFWVAMNQV